MTVVRRRQTINRDSAHESGVWGQAGGILRDVANRRPTLLVDIDGFLNVYGVERCLEGYTEVMLFPEDDEPARLSATHGVWLHELAERFDLVWASAWGFEANEYLGHLLGLDDFPFLPMPAIPFPPSEKVPAVSAYVGGRPAAWLDDIVVAEATRWAEDRGAPTLLIAVDHRLGLRREHVDQLLAWAAGL